MVDTRVYEPSRRALPGSTSRFWEVVVLKPRTVLNGRVQRYKTKHAKRMTMALPVPHSLDCLTCAIFARRRSCDRLERTDCERERERERESVSSEALALSLSHFFALSHNLSHSPYRQGATLQDQARETHDEQSHRQTPAERLARQNHRQGLLSLRRNSAPP